MKKQLVLLAKVAVVAIILALAGWQLRRSWASVHEHPVAVHWRLAPLGVLAFCGVMVTSGLVWVWLVSKMGGRARPPVARLLGAYTFSQMGKYVPGKVVLLLMRIERARRFGVDGQTVTLSTILENALYMVSGGIAGALALPAVLARSEGVNAAQRHWAIPAIVAAVAVLAAVCHPKVFYGLFDRLLVKMKRPPVEAAHRLTMPAILLAVLLFMGCWAFGGLSLWASANCVTAVPAGHLPMLMGGFALSVISGMVSFLPGGLGAREGVLLLFLTFELSPTLGQQAAVVAGVAVVLQRLFQIVAEVLLGVIGAAATAGGGMAAAVAG